MGNDGGSIPTRRELVKEAAKDPNNTHVKETQTEKLQYYWSHCSLSQKTLSPPIVSDSTGNLYNKDAVLENLLNTSKDTRDGNIAGNERTAGTIKGLRDIVEVRFRIDAEQDKEDSATRSNELRLVCPVTGKRLGPGVKAVYLVPCGHAFAETAVREMPGEQCLEVREKTNPSFLLFGYVIIAVLMPDKCNEPYSTENVIPILPVSPTDKDRLRDRLSKLQSDGLTHSLKKAPGSSKKRKQTQSNKKPEAADKSKESRFEPSSDAIRNEDTAALTAKVLAEQEDRNKRRKVAPNENLKALFSSSNGMAGKQSDFMTRGFAIPPGAKR
ncbi:MAG: hypothetical protein LQ339_006495 [Xanthoria mediterranea]|nr:MAG: hypothetical protein LQ339_006495 [Xanthoria mediterranea]